ncbi:MAG: hypothetical protein IPG67_09280 [Acidobacteria bacterium]|nr:hypothetical protein [Acidobacteriota bacterium]
MTLKLVLPLLALIAISSAAFVTAPVQPAIASSIRTIPTPAKKSAVKTIAEITFVEGEFDGVVIARSEAEWKSCFRRTHTMFFERKAQNEPIPEP